MMTTSSSSLENFQFPEVVSNNSFVMQPMGDESIMDGSIRCEASLKLCDLDDDSDHDLPANKSGRASLYKALKTSRKFAGKQLSKLSTEMSGHRRPSSSKAMPDSTDTTYSMDQSSSQSLPQPSHEEDNEEEDDPLSLLPAAPQSLPEIVRKLQEPTPVVEPEPEVVVRREGLSQKRASLMCPIEPQPDVAVRKEALLQKRASLLHSSTEPESPTTSTSTRRRRRPRKIKSSSSGKSKSSRKSRSSSELGGSSRMGGSSSRKSRSSKSDGSSRGRSSRPSTSGSSKDGTKSGSGRRGRSRSVSVAAGKSRGNSKRPSGRRRSRSVSVQAHSRTPPTGPLVVPTSTPVEPVEDLVAPVAPEATVVPSLPQDSKVSSEDEIIQASIADDIKCTWAVAVPTTISTTKTGKAVTKNINMTDWQCCCGENNSEHFQFCGMCGSAPTWQCGSCCRSDNLGRFKFCVGCGTAK